MAPKFQNIAPDVKLGENVRIFDFVNLYGCTIGDNTKVGAFVEIQKNAIIGKNCKISSSHLHLRRRHHRRRGFHWAQRDFHK